MVWGRILGFKQVQNLYNNVSSLCKKDGGSKAQKHPKAPQKHMESYETHGIL